MFRAGGQGQRTIERATDEAGQDLSARSRRVAGSRTGAHVCDGSCPYRHSTPDFDCARPLSPSPVSPSSPSTSNSLFYSKLKYSQPIHALRICSNVAPSRRDFSVHVALYLCVPFRSVLFSPACACRSPTRFHLLPPHFENSSWDLAR